MLFDLSRTPCWPSGRHAIDTLDAALPSSYQNCWLGMCLSVDKAAPQKKEVAEQEASPKETAIDEDPRAP